MNGTGTKVLQEYITKFHENLAKNISTACSIISDLKTELKSDDDPRLKTLLLYENAVHPFGKSDDNRFIVNLDSCKEWSSIIYEALVIIQETEWKNCRVL